MILSILDQLAATTKAKEKVAILEDVKGSEYEDLFKRVVHMAYDPQLTFYVVEFDENVQLDTTLPHDIYPLSDALDYLEREVATRNITGHAAIEAVSIAHASLDPADAEVFKRVIKRDLRCGVGPKTFNKVWPNLNYIHPYMRCKSFSEKNLKKIKFPCYSQTKMDGLYVDVIVTEAGVQYYSRVGNLLTINKPETDDVFANMGRNRVYMGELVATDESGQLLERSESNGYLNRDEIDPNRIKFILWDTITLEEFANRKSTMAYKTRWERLQKQYLRHGQGNKRIALVSTKRCSSAFEVQEHFMANLRSNEEGTVVKDLSMEWKDGDNPLQVKIKAEMDVDLKVVGFKHGRGKHEGLLGALTCRTSDDILEVSVGTGFKDKDREQLMRDVQRMIDEGAVVTVKANDIITNEAKPDMYSLFLPRFIKQRPDKTEADTFNRVKEQRDSFVDTLSAIGGK